MEKIKNFFKNKSVAYYILIANAILALVLGIVFFVALGNHPASETSDGNYLFPNGSESYIPELIGVCALGGFAFELITLALPQYKFIHIGALVMYAIALAKDILIIAPIIADIANNVAYQLRAEFYPVNFFILIALLVLLILGIAIVFMGFYKSEEEERADFVNVKGTKNLVKLGVAGALVVAIIASCSIASANLTSKANTIGVDDGSSQPIDAWDPITDEIRAAADAVEYDFDPSSVLIKEQKAEDYNYNDATLKGLSTSNPNRSDVHLVYYFEGSYAEGYQADYSETYAYLYLWEDGMFAGKSRNTDIRGYWYNSSIQGGVDEDGKDIADCLNMVSNVNHYESIITDKAEGFYEAHAYLYLDMGWGTRSLEVNGYKYYPEAAIFIDAGTKGANPVYKQGNAFSTNRLIVKRVLKNLAYSSVFKTSEVQWDVPAGMLSDGRLAAAGEYELTAKWNGFEAKITVNVEAAD